MIASHLDFKMTVLSNLGVREDSVFGKTVKRSNRISNDGKLTTAKIHMTHLNHTAS